ncbi:MAG: hypothetical protein R2838_25525 [Caldilineaceae bacterium]
MTASSAAQGLGAAVLDAGLRRLQQRRQRLRRRWTDLVDFYGKFGFAPYRAYQQLVKAL